MSRIGTVETQERKEPGKVQERKRAKNAQTPQKAKPPSF